MPFSERGKTLKIVIVTSSANGQGMGILVVILVLQWTKSISELGSEFDENNQYMKFERNRVVNA